jgi:hypothetical protein
MDWKRYIIMLAKYFAILVTPGTAPEMSDSTVYYGT